MVGEGSKRFSFFVSHPGVVKCLLLARVPQEESDIQSAFTAGLSIDSDRATELVEYFVKQEVLVPESLHVSQTHKLWESCGWRDALDFHKATTDLIFTSAYEPYKQEMEQRLERAKVGAEIPQPGPYKDYPNAEHIPLKKSSDLLNELTVFDVFKRSRPFRNYGAGPIASKAFAELMQHSYSVTSEHTNILGAYFRRTSPSGGARHPHEVYVYAHSIEGLPMGIYHYAPKSHELALIKSGNFRDEITKLCFGKPGIKTAPLVTFITVRWLRHMWKYRYARSYRMVLYDTGHLIQTHLLTSTALGLQSFINPAIFDQGISDLLELGPDRLEGPLYAIGTGNQAPSFDNSEQNLFFPNHAY